MRRLLGRLSFVGFVMAGAFALSVVGASATAGGSAYDVPAVVDINPDPMIVETTITAEEATVDIGGVTADMQTFNGSVPGPEFRLTVGQRVIVHFENQLPDEATGIHWHGIELQNQMDGTPLTQDQVPAGDSYTYDFVVTRPGVFWYHPHHQFSSNQVFKGMYGSIIVEDPNDPALVADGTLPSVADTHTLLLASTTVCKAPGSNDTATYDPSLPWAGGGPLPVQPDPTPFTLCEGSPVDHFGAALPAGETHPEGAIPNVNPPGTRVNEGQTVLTNGMNVGGRAGDPSSPGSLASGAQTLTVQPGQGVRLQLINAATTRFFRLRLTLADGTLVPLVRVGGEGGLLDSALVPGGTLALDKLATGELLLDPGDRDDVVAVFPDTASGVATLWTLDMERTGQGFSNIPTVPVAHFDVTGSAVAPAYSIGDGTPLRAATGDPVEVLPAATDTLIDPSTLVPAKPGMASSDIKLTVTGGPSIDGVTGHHDYTTYYGTHPAPDSARYAKVGDLLELSVTNQTAAHHPFHLHGFSIQPLTMASCDGPVSGFSFPRVEFVDNIDVPPGCTLTFRVRIDDRAHTDGVTPGGALGRWMFHCHIFFHHDRGMVSELVVTDDDGNERPFIDVDGVSVSGTEGDILQMTGVWLDPEGDDVTLTASVGAAVANGDGTWTWTWDDTDGPFSGFVYVTATDAHGATGQVAFEVEVTNVAPTVEFDPGQVEAILEGDTLTVSASFSDPGVDEPYTATIDFGTGDAPQPATVTMTSTSPPQTGTVGGSLTYGDDGAFTVTVSVTDDDGATGQASFVVTVGNVDPDVTTAVGAVVIGQLGDPIHVDGRITDPGSDDITSTWHADDGSPDEVQVSLVNPPGADPDPSPSVQPRDVEHDFDRVFDDGCVRVLTFSAIDDDGGADELMVSVVLVGDDDEPQRAGYWMNEYRPIRNRDHSDAQLECFLEITRLLSDVFDETQPLTTLADGFDVLSPAHDNDPIQRLDRELLMGWLNLASGSIGWDELVDTDKDKVADTAFGDVLIAAEAIRLDPTSTRTDLVDAQRMLERINKT